MPSKITAAAPLYRRIIKDAWHIAWVHKHLWVFGFFATFLSFGGVSEVLFGIFDHTSGTRPDAVHFGTLGILPGIAALHGVARLSPVPVVSVVLYLALLATFIGLFAYVVSLAIGGLIHGIRKVERGGEPTFSEGIEGGKAHVWQVFSANLLSKAIIALAFILTGANLVLYLGNATIIGGLFYLASFVIFTGIAVFAAVTGVYATMSIVIDKTPFEKAWPQAWHLAKDNWLVSLEMVALLTLANITVAILALFGAMVLSVPLIFLFLVGALIQSQVFMVFMIALSVAALLSLLLLICSFMTTFQVAAWFLLWKELAAKPPVPNLIRLINSWIAKRH